MYIRARDVRRDAHKFACRIVQLIRATSLYKASILPLIKEKMNSLKARLISLKKRVCRLCCKKRKSVRRKTAALYSRRVTSSLRKLSTIRRLRMTIRRRRAQPSCNADSASAKKIQFSHSQSIEEQAQETSLHPIETMVEATVQPTRELSSPTGSLSNIEPSSTVPSLTLQPPCTLLSVCTTVTPPRSPSLTSWDSWSSMSSSDSEEDMSMPTDLTHSENVPNSNNVNDDDDDDDDDEMAEGDNVASHSTISITQPVPPNVSSGIVADCSQDCCNCNDANESTSLSWTSSEEELTTLFGDTDEDRETPNVGAQPIDPPRLSSIPTTSDVKEVVPVQYNFAWMPNDHLLVPPFTEEQERYIVETNHPYKEFVLQRWGKMLQSCLEQACPQSSVTMSRTSSEEELRSIFVLEDTDDDDDEICQQLEPETPKCDPPFMTLSETQFNEPSFQSTGDGSYSSLISQQSCYCPCASFIPPQVETTSQLTLTSSGHFNFAPAVVDEWLHSQAATTGQSPDFASLSSLPPLSSAASTVVPEQNDTPSTHSKPPPLKLTSLSCAANEPVPPTLSLPAEESVTTPPPPPGPSTAEAEQMWNKYTANRSIAPEYFLYPPFTPEQEKWIIKIDHPFKEYVLQTWQVSIHSSVQEWLDDLVQ